MKFAFIAAEKATYPVEMLCTVLEVSRSDRAPNGTKPGARR